MRTRYPIDLRELPPDIQLCPCCVRQDDFDLRTRGRRERIHDGPRGRVEREEVGTIQHRSGIVGCLDLSETPTDVHGVADVTDGVHLAVEHPGSPVVGVVAGQLNRGVGGLRRCGRYGRHHSERDEQGGENGNSTRRSQTSFDGHTNPPRHMARTGLRRVKHSGGRVAKLTHG